MQDLPDRDIAKPRKLGKWQEKLFILQQEPEAVLRDVRDLNGGSAYATRNGCHLHASELNEVLRESPAAKDLYVAQTQWWAQAKT